LNHKLLIWKFIGLLNLGQQVWNLGMAAQLRQPRCLLAEENCGFIWAILGEGAIAKLFDHTSGLRGLGLIHRQQCASKATLRHELQHSVAVF
jgi:hypothetical protein